METMQLLNMMKGDSGANIMAEEGEADSGDMAEVAITEVTDMAINMDTEAIVAVVDII